MSQLNVYKASAGSGKTFRLAIEYMKLALTRENNFRHILAVTFTNKATAEMKSRIVHELYQLSRGYPTGYLKILTEELGWPEIQVQQQAALVLKHILHDYSRFSVSTIDSFFQRVIKSFSRELGINAVYNVELDQAGILEEAADRLVHSVEDDPNLRDWLNDFAAEKIRDGRGWNLKRDIIALGSEIFNETFKSLNDQLYNKLNDRIFIRAYHDKLTQIIDQYEKTLKQLGTAGINLMAAENISPDEFKGGKKQSVALAFQKLKDLNFEPTKTTTEAAGDPSAWVTKATKDPDRSRLEAAAKKLMPLLKEAINVFEAHSRRYFTAKIISGQLFTLGILVDLNRNIREICREKGLVLISDSGQLLRNVISDSEAPFVYEKTGSVYNHFMIDEFQDTSGLQWNNFRPLIANSLAEGNYGLVVGDVKQAIYRWRSGDWRLLAGGLQDSFPVFGLKNQILSSNWRSHGLVIRFNNSVFSVAPVVLQQQYNEALTKSGLDENPVPFSVEEVYAGGIQQISNPDKKDAGYVRVRFLENKRDKQEENLRLILAELVKFIRNLQDQGIQAKEMAILVRDKKDARQIAECFLQQKELPENAGYNFDILSNESLFVTSSEVISFIVALLESFLNPDDPIVRAEVNYLYYQKLYPRLKASGNIPVLQAEKQDGQQVMNFGAAYEPTLEQQFEEADNEYNTLIRFLHEQQFQDIVTGKPVLEIVYNICEKFRLFSLQEDLAYLQAFVDQISQFERNHASELTGFLDWWNDNGATFTIPVSDSIDAVTVQTIHKSKGLEYSYVFVPFCDWSLSPKTGQQAPLLWCLPQEPPFNDMELVPVSYSTSMEKSLFFREFYTEKFNTYVDNLNLLYVAFTRAKAGLWIWAPVSDKLSTTGDLLSRCIKAPGTLIKPENLEVTVNLAELLDNEQQVFELGTTDFSKEKSSENSSGNVRLNKFEFTDFRRFLSIKKQSDNFFTRENKQQNSVNQGRIIHEILSMVVTSNDLGPAIKKMVFDGKLSASFAEHIRQTLHEILHDPEVKSWFDGSYQVVNERNILTGNDGLKRPDRIMISPDEVIVVDYKSGEQESEKYKYQVRSYIKELKRCGYPNVKGYLWYTKNNKRVAI
jgi:ATP-dependent exoDNAse (exonuclease V) beta subunit